MKSLVSAQSFLRIGVLCLAVSVTMPINGALGNAMPRGGGSWLVGGNGLNPRLVSLLRRVSDHYGKPVIVSSGCRTHHGNRRAGGARRSLHLACKAADIKVPGISEAQLLRYVKSLPGRGGVGTYCRNSVVHLDVGEKREWHYGCKIFGKRKAAPAVAAR
jgi:hypothetical protein